MSSVTTGGKGHAVAFTGLRRAQFIDWPMDDSPLKDHEIAGRTLASLISPGTEVNGGFDRPRDTPAVWGYAAVFEIDAIGSAVEGFAAGQRVFCLGNHASRQRFAAVDAYVLPSTLTPKSAVFARLMAVTWTTLVTTRARPVDRVLVQGLGVIGNLAAQIFQSAGYRVTAIDPVETRRQIATECGIADVRPAAVGQKDLVDQVALTIDCSGHEQAVLDACRIVRKGGEVVLVGVPWKRQTDLLSFDLLDAVFRRYVTLRSGWEWELPRQPQEFAAGSIRQNIEASLQWLAEGRVNVEGLARIVAPSQAQAVYDDLLHHRGGQLSAIFDWEHLEQLP